MIPIARYLTTHAAADNATIYTPTFTDTNPSGAILNNGISGSIGYWSPLYYGVHNYSADQDITIWTVDQGTDGAGVTIHLLQGHTINARIAKLTVTNPVALLGTTNMPGVI